MKTEEKELTYREVKAAQDKADLANVIDSLSKIGFFADASEEDKFILKQNIAVLEKMYDRETK